MLKTLMVAMTSILIAGPALAQVEYDTSQLDQRAEIERNRILLRSTLHQNGRRVAARRATGTPAQAAACADRPRFRREYGATNPKVKRLEALCAQAGY